MVEEFIQQSDEVELRELANMVRRFATQELAPTPDNIGAPQFHRPHFDRMGALGLAGSSIPEQFGGSAVGTLGSGATVFDLARVQLGPAIYLSVHLMVSKLIALWHEQGNAPWQPLLAALADGRTLGAFALTEPTAGSDAAALRTRALRDGDDYLLSGEKIYITSAPHADLFLVFARTAEDRTKGISAFVVERGTQGLTIGKAEKKMGCTGAPIASLHFDRCRVPGTARLGQEGDGLKIALSGLNGGRVSIAAAACGLASRALELATAHARSRTQFGSPIGHFQGMQFMLADMTMKTRAAILLTRDAAARIDAGVSDNLAASIAKCFATDAAMAVTTDGVQALGGAGYLEEYEVERLMRDAKMLQIVEGTNQIQRMVIAKAILNA